MDRFLINSKYNNNMKKITTFPPLYFFLSIIFCILSHWLVFDTLFYFPYNMLGLIPAISGYILLHKASGIFEKKETTFYLERPSVFVTEGNFKVSRNPMYLGALILIFGLAIIIGKAISFLAPLFFFLMMNFVCIPAEETIMERTFGQSYLDYKRKIRRWI